MPAMLHPLVRHDDLPLMGGNGILQRKVHGFELEEGEPENYVQVGTSGACGYGEV